MFPIDLDHYVFMKKKWHVSVGVMIRRAYNIVITFSLLILSRSLSFFNYSKNRLLLNSSIQYFSDLGINLVKSSYLPFQSFGT